MAILGCGVEPFWKSLVRFQKIIQMDKAKNIKELEMSCMEECSKSSLQVSSTLVNITKNGCCLSFVKKYRKNMQHDDRLGTGSAIQVTVSHGLP